MKRHTAYTRLQNSDSMPLLLRLRYSLLVFFVAALATTSLSGQDESQFDEFPVYVKVPYIGVTEIDAVIRGETVFLSVPGLFDFLKIRNIPSSDLETVSGFFINPDDTYLIDRAGNRITYGNKTWDLSEGDLVRSESSLYLRSDYFGKVFGLECNFSFRDLMVTIDTKLELPAIREMRQEEMRKNITRLRGEIVVDTTIGRTYPGFRFGMADWAVYASEQPDGQSMGRFNLSLGSVIAGGEANADLTWNTGTAFGEKQQYYMWRHVNNDRTWMRQVIAGKINAQPVSSIYNPVLGVQVTNRPTTFRRSFGTYTLTDRTEPGWTVELYVNNVLVDYVKADASGFFTFEVPLVYGNTLVKLKFYGPWGEERTREQNINIPYNFLPHKELEYTVSAGVVEDSLWSRLARTTIRYGATKFITLGAGFEYLSSVSGSPLMPFADASVRIANNLLVSGEYTHRVRSRGTLTWRLPSNIQLELLYTLYDKDQKAISYNYLEERKASLSLPLRIAGVAGYSRLSYYQIIFPESQYTSAEWVLAASLSRVTANLTTYGVFSDYFKPGVYSNLSLGVRLPAKFVIMPQLQYNYSKGEFISARINLEKRLFRNGYMNGSYERNFRYNMNIGEIGIRWDFSFAQAGISARQTNEYTTFVQYARGSLINDRRTSFIKADNRTNVGRGGISVIAFLDLNANGVRDPGEPKAAGLNLRSNGGRIERSEKDTIIHIIGLEPYVKHFIEVDENNFDNISWRIPQKTFAVVVDPNMLKTIEIPVKVAGEATGTVTLEKNGIRKGQSRIIVNFHRPDDVVIGRVLTEEDGYYSYFGLTPGDYYVAVDTAQLRRLNLTSDPASLTFTIKTDLEGDYVEGLDFTLRSSVVIPDTIIAADTTTAAMPDTTAAVLPPERTIQTDTSYLVIHEVTRELVTITEDYYAVQFGAFRTKLYAEIMKQKVEAALDKDVELFEEDGFWKVRITGFKDRDDLEKYIPVIHGQGITEIWVITNKAVRGDWITTTREDSLAMVRETVTEKPIPIIVSGNTIQLGAFETAEETEPVSDRLLAATEKLVTIRQEEGVYKVQLSGFADTSEIRDFIPLLQQHGFTDITVLHQTEAGLVPVLPQDTTAAAGQPEPEETPVPLHEPEPQIVKPVQPEISEEVAPPPPAPRFILHAGYYHKRSQAERARRKLERSLDKPVELLEEWDGYRVVVTGFFTREETYPYYPELAGLGFSEVFVYEKPLIDR
jgi:cell division protein FtsN